MVSKIKQKLPILFFVIGLLMCSYPLAVGLLESYSQRDTIKSYENSFEKDDKKILEEDLEKAHKYNDVLFQTNGAYVGNVSKILSDDSYQSILNHSGTGIMGSIDIPIIDVALPIYHGTSDEILSNSVGHVKESSFPVGGKNTRSLLTAHRGLPSSKLFTRLDEIMKDDLFYINIYGETLAYKVIDIQEILPEQVDKLEIIPEKDLVSLITCTPYGINTHRLVVTGERIPYEKDIKESIHPKMMSGRELVFTIIPFMFIGLVIVKTKRLLIYKEKKEE